MERKVPPPPPPPRGFGGPPAAQPFARRPAPPATANSEQKAPAPPPPQSFGFPAARGPVNTNAGATRRGWRPGRVGGRHDSPLYGKHRKRPSSSSIDSNVSWSGSEIESVGAAHSEQEQVSRLSWASSVAAKDEAPPAVQQDLAPAASLFGAPAVEQRQQPQPLPPLAAVSGERATTQSPGDEAGMGVQPPKTPLGKPTQVEDAGISAAQRVRMELSGSRAGSRANSSENVFASAGAPGYDEEKNGPQSCPSTFNNTRQPQFSIDKLRQLRSNELVASKLLPTRTSVNSLMGYVRELQLSEATLRKQLVKTKQHTEEELSNSLSKVSELERTMHEVERDRELARRKLEEQEQLIRDLAAKLKQAEAVKTKSSAAPAVDELPPIAEEAFSQAETEAKATAAEEREPETSAVSAPPVQPRLPPRKQQEQPPIPPVHPDQPKNNGRAAQFGLASPRSPNRPLWDPWASGGATPMKNLPPVFTIGSTGLDPVAASSASTAQASTTDATATVSGEYELKSVLMSPRRIQGQVEASKNGHLAQQVEQDESTAATQQDFAPHYPAPVFNLGAMPSPLYPQQDNSFSSETQNEAYGMQGQEEVPLMESPSQAVPMLPAETMTPGDDTSFEQQNSSSFPAEGNSTGARSAEWSGFQAQQQAQPPPVSFPPVGGDVVDSEQSTILPPPQAIAESDASEVPTPSSESAQAGQPEQASIAEAEDVGAGTPSAPPMGSSPSPTSEVQPPHLASTAQKESKAVASEPVSLESLLVDFFTEVDKKRLKMAKTYGKRYAGREKWLFAELTKRYGAAKVAALKARYENGSGGEASTPSSSVDNGQNDHHGTKSADGSDHPKAGRQGHPRHPQFFHPPTPASNVDLSAGVPPVASRITLPLESDASSTQLGQEAGGSGAPPSPRGNVSPGREARMSPGQRPSGSNIPTFAGPPPSFPTPQATGEGNTTSTDVTDGPSMTSGPPAPGKREKPDGQFRQPPPSPFQPGMENNNAAPTGLRQRHNASGPNTQGQKNVGDEPPAVTLEGLLKELYKKHQPDKLKNVSIVAKQYTGKERELVGLLKGKYGALSVKRLEENLEVLEHAHRVRTAGTGAGKKRGCFARTISLMFWLSVLLYFSFGAVFVSFVVLDAWECHALDNDEQELESEECLPLKKELDTFTYERVADYSSQSHPDACFCSEWKTRESALFSNMSGNELVNLVKLVPFSPESFGAPWIVSVKEQVPSQEFYDSYAKPVVDLSLDVGSFVWSSVVELAGYDEASEEKHEVVEDVMENDTADIPSLAEESENDAYTDSLEQAAEEVENESFVSSVEVDDKLTEEIEMEAEPVEMPETLEEVPVEEEAIEFDDEVQIDETDAVAKDDVSMEDAIDVEEEFAAIDEDISSVASEAEGEDNTGVESTYVLESDDVPPVGEPESVDADEEGPAAAAAETEVVEDEAVIAPVEETESVAYDDDEASASFEDEAVDATIDEVKKVSEAEVEEESEAVVQESEEASAEEHTGDSDDVVEVEVRQEGLELLYPEMEADATEEELAAEPTEVSSPALEKFEPAVDAGGDVPSEVGEAEPEVVVESENISVDTLEEFELVVDAVEGGLATPSAADAEIEARESELDEDAASEAFDVEIEHVQEEPVDSSKDVGVEASPEFSEESELDVETASESSIRADVDDMLESEDEEGAASEEPEVDTVKGELDAATETEVEEEIVSDEEEVIVSEEDYADVVVEEEESVATAAEIELSSISNDVDMEVPLSEESTVSLSTEDAEAINEEGDGDEGSATPVEVGEPSSENADANLDEEGGEVVASNDDYESGIPADAEASIPELELEEDVAAAVNEAEEQELPENPENEAAELKEGVEEVTTTVPVEVEPVAEEGNEVEDELSSSSDAEVGSFDKVVDEVADVDNDDAESTTLSEIEVEQSASEVELVSELAEESVAIEASEAPADVDTDTAEHAEGVGDQVEDTDGTGGFVGEEVDTPAAADETESAVVAEEEAPGAGGEASAVPANGEAPAVDDEVAAAVGVADSDEGPAVGEPIESVESSEEASNADGLAATAVETEPEQVADVSSTSAEEEGNGGLVSAVNEVLARLVEPFEAAKTAAPIAESGHEVDEL
ncbi:hypothetical protein PHYPSEUDO_000269 [Phytophthora pseudosyringae]|uniref:Uncharacterized protein n=1 Tax=Phytophthora pseudosyringae TaxID=221518 RepID=A0A8T1W2K4_9STRA|nr:hypothetical protein PHYPSEUDO_000269 [Phytophthora pseudosyringae]